MAYSTVIANPAGGKPYVVHVDDGLSRRGRAAAWVLALALLATGAGTLYAVAAPQLTGAETPRIGSERAQREAEMLGRRVGAPAAAGTAAATDAFADDIAETSIDGAIRAEWDGPTTHLDWQGKRYETAIATCVGERIASPGDDTRRTLKLANAGPEAATLSVGLRVDEMVPAIVNNPELAEGIDLFWTVAGVQGEESFAELLEAQQSGTPVIAQIPVQRGETITVTVGFDMDLEETQFRMLGAESVQLSFDVLARMSGDTTTAEPPVRGLPRTGAAVLGWAALAAGLLGAGWLLLAVRYGGRCDECGRRLRRGARCAEYDWGAGRPYVRCARCDAAGVLREETIAGGWPAGWR